MSFPYIIRLKYKVYKITKFNETYLHKGKNMIREDKPRRNYNLIKEAVKNKLIFYNRIPNKPHDFSALLNQASRSTDFPQLHPYYTLH